MSAHDDVRRPVAPPVLEGPGHSRDRQRGLRPCPRGAGRGAKDLLAVPGYRTTWGAKPYEDQVLDEKATVVSRPEDAGAVLVAKLSMGALAWGNVWYGGETKNPWNVEQGPIARPAEDCALVFHAVEGRDGPDPTAVDGPFRWPYGRDVRRTPEGLRALGIVPAGPPGPRPRLCRRALFWPWRSTQSPSVLLVPTGV